MYNTEGERPSSARSGMTAITGGMTNAFTQFTAGTNAQSKFSQATEKQEAMLQAQQVMLNKNFSLVEYIKYDTTLGREQNIDLGKESSLVSKDVMRIKGGIKLTEFAPQKRLTKATTEEEVEDEFDNNPALMEFEKKTLRRLKMEKEGLIQPRQELSVEVGPESVNPNKLSLKQYQKKFANNMGTIGKVEEKV